MTVLCDGCFDPLHYGHVRYLTAASGYGPPLVVNIADDDAIRAKGRVPFQSRAERARTVLALAVVDRVCSHADLATAIRAVKPRYLAKGMDWRDHLPADVLAACHDVGTEILYMPTMEKSSSQRLHA